jgi:hypothetical protein
MIKTICIFSSYFFFFLLLLIASYAYTTTHLKRRKKVKQKVAQASWYLVEEKVAQVPKAANKK